MSRVKIKDELFICNFCGRTETVRLVSKKQDAPLYWLTFNVNDDKLDMCETCAGGLADIFLKSGVLDELLLQIRLGNLGYNPGRPAFDPKLIAGICPNCLSINDAQIKKAIDKVVEYWEKITGEMDKSSD